MRFMRNVSDGQVQIENGQVMAEDFFAAAHKTQEIDSSADWVKDFEAGKQSEGEWFACSSGCNIP